MKADEGKSGGEIKANMQNIFCKEIKMRQKKKKPHPTKGNNEVNEKYGLNFERDGLSEATGLLDWDLM